MIQDIVGWRSVVEINCCALLWKVFGVVNVEPSVTDRLFGRFFRFVFVFEPLAPQAVSYYLRRRLGGWKSQGIISGYSAKTKRLGVFHYRISVELELNEKQVHYIARHLLPREIGTVRRWLNV